MQNLIVSLAKPEVLAKVSYLTVNHGAQDLPAEFSDVSRLNRFRQLLQAASHNHASLMYVVTGRMVWRRQVIQNVWTPFPSADTLKWWTSIDLSEVFPRTQARSLATIMALCCDGYM